jgi:hypothetical protein
LMDRLDELMKLVEKGYAANRKKHRKQ